MACRRADSSWFPPTTPTPATARSGKGWEGYKVHLSETSADLLLGSRARGITLLGPLLSGSPPQARAGGYTAEAFAIDWDHQQVTCPQGAASTVWCPCVQQRKRQAI